MCCSFQELDSLLSTVQHFICLSNTLTGGGSWRTLFCIICKFWGTRIAPFISLSFGCLRSSGYHAYRVRTHVQCGGSSKIAETVIFFPYFIRKQCCSNRRNLQVFSCSDEQKALLISESRNVTWKWCINIY